MPSASAPAPGFPARTTRRNQNCGPALSQQVSGLLCVPGEVHGLESLHRLFEENMVAAGAERERLGEGALLQPVRRFCLDALAIAERGKRVQEGGNRLPLPVEVG